MPKIIERDKPRVEVLTLPNTAFMKVNWQGETVYCLPTNTPDPMIKQFWAVLLHNDASKVPYCFEILFDVQDIPEFGFESKEYNCIDDYNGWYVIGNMSLYDFIDKHWQINLDYWVIDFNSLVY